MSSRAQHVGSAPNSGIYNPTPTPAEQDDIPTYINDEFLRLGGIVNGVLEGGAFPPQSELPKRVREGMMIYFTKPIPNSDIFSAGVFLYKEGKWWKIIDDPTSIEGVIQLFKLGSSSRPATPSPSKDNPAGWTRQPPVKSNKSQYIWAIVNVAFDYKTSIYSWSVPVIWSAGVTDGKDGADGPPGIGGDVYEWWFIESAGTPERPSSYPPIGWSRTPPTEQATLPVWQTFTRVSPDGSWTPFSYPIRISGDTGGEGQRGFIGVQIQGTRWDDGAAWDAIVANTQGLNPPQPIPWDNVTIYDTGTNFSESKRFVRGNTRPGVWEPVASIINGDQIVNGTIAGSKLMAGAITAREIAADSITGNEINAGTRIVIGGNQAGNQDVVVVDGTDPNWRLWVGNLDSQQASFKVSANGDVYANTGRFKGEIYADKLNGDVVHVGDRRITSSVSSISSSGTRLASLETPAITTPEGNPADVDLQVELTSDIEIKGSGDVQVDLELWWMTAPTQATMVDSVSIKQRVSSGQTVYRKAGKLIFKRGGIYQKEKFELRVKNVSNGGSCSVSKGHVLVNFQRVDNYVLVLP